MESEIEAERRRSVRWIVLLLSVTYLTGIGRAWDMYGTVPLWTLVAGAIIEILSAVFIWYVWIPYRVRRRRPGSRVDYFGPR